MRSEITMYTLSRCPDCEEARRKLREHGIMFREIVVADDDICTRLELEERTNLKSFPQIFVGNLPLGGVTDLLQYDEKFGLQIFKSKGA